MTTDSTAHRLLIVEDEALIAEETADRLTRMGYQVLGIADTGPGAIAMAQELVPDLVFMDIRLKGAMSGIEAAEQIYQHNLRLLRDCDGVLVNLSPFRGVEPDSGSVFEARRFSRQSRKSSDRPSVQSSDRAWDARAARTRCSIVAVSGTVKLISPDEG